MVRGSHVGKEIVWQSVSRVQLKPRNFPEVANPFVLMNIMPASAGVGLRQVTRRASSLGLGVSSLHRSNPKRHAEPHSQPEDWERVLMILLIGWITCPVPSDGASAALGAKSAPLSGRTKYQPMCAKTELTFSRVPIISSQDSEMRRSIRYLGIMFVGIFR
jgi:hypothetical protein